MSERLSFDFACRRMAATATLNGFLITSSADARPTVQKLDVTALLVPGENRLEVSCEPLAARGQDDEPPFLDCGLYDGRPLPERDPADVLAATQVDPSVTKLTEGRSTRVLAHRFVLERTAAVWAFTKAPPLDERRAAELAELARSVRDALDRRDLRALLTLYGHRLTEMALATGLSRAQIESDFSETWLEVLSEPGVRCDPIEPRFEPALGGRVAHARGPSGGAPFLVRTDGGAYALGLSAAVVDNVVRVVR